MLSLIRRIFCPRCFPWGTGSLCEECEIITPVERWAKRNAKLCSPEDLIEAHIIRSIAKDFDDWELVAVGKGTPGLTRDRWYEEVKTIKEKHPHLDVQWLNRLLRNRRKHRNVKTVNILWSDNCNDLEDYFSNFFVNGIQFRGTSGSNIVEAFETINRQRQEAAAVAAKALREQQANEAKWNLAEELLGMVRNEHGALVPAKTAEG